MASLPPHDLLTCILRKCISTKAKHFCSVAVYVIGYNSHKHEIHTTLVRWSPYFLNPRNVKKFISLHVSVCHKSWLWLRVWELVHAWGQFKKPVAKIDGAHVKVVWKGAEEEICIIPTWCICSSLLPVLTWVVSVWFQLNGFCTIQSGLPWGVDSICAH